ncbi:MAG: FG-GAP repeat protein [Bacteroidetes bacterium]|nr:FG-GAP repeat protein [Bacteroidota bacterium]
MVVRNRWKFLIINLILTINAFGQNSDDATWESQASSSRWFSIRKLVQVEGRPDSADKIGSGFASLPDINGDGYKDFAVSALGRRETMIYFAGPGILDSIPDLILPGGGVICTGDFNGDGLTDLGIHNSPFTYDLITGNSIDRSADSIFIFLGDTGQEYMYAETPNVKLSIKDTTSSDWDFGNSMASGDFNGDGCDELISSAPHFRDSLDGPCNIGRVIIYLGEKNNPLTKSWILRPEKLDTCHQGYGNYVFCEDANGDGIGDIFISSYLVNINASPRQRYLCTIYYGKENIQEEEVVSTQTIDLTEQNAYAYGQTPLDMNNDAIADLPVPGPHGSVYILRGTRSGYSFDNKITLRNPDTTICALFLGQCYNVGDFNGDGNDDFLLSYAFNPWTGRIVVLFEGGYAGIKDTALVWLGRYLDQNYYGRQAAFGDYNGDGLADFCVGSATRNLILPRTNFHRGMFEIVRGDRTTLLTAAMPWYDISDEQIIISLYPNPGQLEFNIEIQNSTEGSVVVELVSVVGERLKQVMSIAARKTNHVKLSREELGVPPGVYFIVAYGDGRVVTRAIQLL